MSREIKREIYQAEVPKKQGNNPSTSESSYTVPAGKSLRIERFAGGFEHSTHECRIELLADDDLIAVGYAGAFQYTVDIDIPENVAVKIKLFNGDPGVLNMAGWWEGVVR